MSDGLLFAAVEFPDDPNVAGMVYWYYCPLEGVNVGDEIIAPLGRHNTLQKGVVRKIKYATEQAAPYPFDRIKRVVSFADGRGRAIAMENVTQFCVGVNVYKNGQATLVKKGEPAYLKICAAIEKLIKTARPMPAFGVSLNDETLKAREKGIWTELLFDGQYVYEEMPFEKLLIKVERESSGFNLHRYLEGAGYVGRCFYLDLDGGNMAPLYDVL